MHVLYAYAEEAGIPAENVPEMRLELFFDRRKMFDTSNRFVAVHAAYAGWKNRTLPREMWKEVIDRLKLCNFKPILIGTERDDVPGAKCLRMFAPDIHAQARLIHSCACFVGSDSAMLHIAGATDTPIVGIFTSVLPEYRMPFRDVPQIALTPDIGCIGCLERQPIPSTTETCERGDIACVRVMRASDIITAVVSLV